MAEISDEAGTRARQMYADDETIAAIRSRTKLTLEGIYYWVDGAEGRLPPLPRRAISGRRLGKRSSPEAMIRRMMRAAERQLADVELRLPPHGVEAAEPERNARTLAVVVRTIRDLSALDETQRKLSGGRNKSNDEALPRNVDDLRRSLLSKLETLVAEQQAEVPEPPRLAYVPATGLGVIPPHRRRLPQASRPFDDLFRHGDRRCRRNCRHQFLALPARAARRFCVVRRFRRLRE